MGCRLKGNAFVSPLKGTA